jgi:hypothetical protein
VLDDLAKRAVEFRADNSQMAMTISSTSSGAFVLAIFGAASVERVAELLTRMAREMGAKFVTGYFGKSETNGKDR